MSDIGNKLLRNPFKLEGKVVSESVSEQCGHIYIVYTSHFYWKQNWNQKKNRSVQCGHMVRLYLLTESIEFSLDGMFVHLTNLLN